MSFFTAVEELTWWGGMMAIDEVAGSEEDGMIVVAMT